MTDYIIVSAAILLADWGAASSHMAYDVAIRKPFYDEKLPIFGDPWHLIAGLRYLPLGLLAFTLPWPWIVGVAVVNWIGWQCLKKVHNKPWSIFVWRNR